MEVIAVALTVGVLLSLVTGGSLARILDARVRWVGLAFAALGAQLVLGLWEPPGGWSEGPARAVFIASFLSLAVFCARNLALTGMSVVLVGVLMNTAAVAVDGGMPVRLPSDASPERREELEASITHLPEEEADAGALGRIVPVPGPWERTVSFGDLVLAAGLVDVVFRAGRVPRRRRRRDPAGDDGDDGDDESAPPAAGPGPGSGDGELAVLDGGLEGGEDALVADAAHR